MKIIVLQIIRGIFVLPILVLLFSALYNAIKGMAFFEQKYYGFEAFRATFVLLVSYFWWVFVISLVGIIVISIILKKNVLKEDIKNA